jgi:hypothetical protein
MADKTLGEQLLDLTTEYQAAVQYRDTWARQVEGFTPAGREPAAIADEYQSKLRQLLAS